MVLKMKRVNNSKVLNYYKQLINRKKLEISNCESELLLNIYLGVYHIHVFKEMPDENNSKQFKQIHMKLCVLHKELLELQDKYNDIKGLEGMNL